MKRVNIDANKRTDIFAIYYLLRGDVIFNSILNAFQDALSRNCCKIGTLKNCVDNADILRANFGGNC